MPSRDVARITLGVGYPPRATPDQVTPTAEHLATAGAASPPTPRKPSAHNSITEAASQVRAIVGVR